MPPKSVADQMNRSWYRRMLGRQVGFRFFPQCRDCSSVQGSILSKAVHDMNKQSAFRQLFSLSSRRSRLLSNSHRMTHFHGLTPRINHWTGAVLGGMAVVGASDADLMDGNRWRYAHLHRRLGKWIETTTHGSRRDAAKLWPSLIQPPRTR
jgi:hypothetical protein